jgi:hypothetical protein
MQQQMAVCHWTVTKSGQDGQAIKTTREREAMECEDFLEPIQSTTTTCKGLVNQSNGNKPPQGGFLLPVDRDRDVGQHTGSHLLTTWRLMAIVQLLRASILASS